MSFHVANNCSVQRFDRKDLRQVQNSFVPDETFAVKMWYAAVICYMKAHQHNSAMHRKGQLVGLR